MSSATRSGRFSAVVWASGSKAFLDELLSTQNRNVE